MARLTEIHRQQAIRLEICCGDLPHSLSFKKNKLLGSKFWLLCFTAYK
jgi:hypothetical protein